MKFLGSVIAVAAAAAFLAYTVGMVLDSMDSEILWHKVGPQTGN